jgi:hypothetical protein
LRENAAVLLAVKPPFVWCRGGATFCCPPQGGAYATKNNFPKKEKKDKFPLLEKTSKMPPYTNTKYDEKSRICLFSLFYWSKVKFG